MKDLIKAKADAAGLPTKDGKSEFASHFDELKVNVDSLESEEEKRAAKVKNISLRLLGISSPL